MTTEALASLPTTDISRVVGGDAGLQKQLVDRFAAQAARLPGWAGSRSDKRHTWCGYATMRGAADIARLGGLGGESDTDQIEAAKALNTYCGDR